MTTPFDKATVLDRVRERRALLESVLTGFPPEQMTVPHPPDGWSVHDVLAHITFWEDYALERLGEMARGESPKLFGNVSEDDVNRINQEALEAGRAKPLATVRAEFASVYQALLAQVEALPDDPADPFWTRWSSIEPDLPWKLVEYNTYGHYDEHLPTLRAWIGG